MQTHTQTGESRDWLTGRQTDGQTGEHRHRERQTYRQTDRHAETDRRTHGLTGRDRDDRHTERQRDRETETDRQTDRQRPTARGRQTDRQTEADRQRQTYRQRETARQAETERQTETDRQRDTPGRHSDRQRETYRLTDTQIQTHTVTILSHTGSNLRRWPDGPMANPIFALARAAAVALALPPAGRLLHTGLPGRRSAWRPTSGGQTIMQCARKRSSA